MRTFYEQSNKLIYILHCCWSFCSPLFPFLFNLFPFMLSIATAFHLILSFLHPFSVYWSRMCTICACIYKLFISSFCPVLYLLDFVSSSYTPHHLLWPFFFVAGNEMKSNANLKCTECVCVCELHATTGQHGIITALALCDMKTEAGKRWLVPPHIQHPAPRH